MTPGLGSLTFGRHAFSMRARAWITVATLVLLTLGMAYGLVALEQSSPTSGPSTAGPSLILSQAEFCQRPGIDDTLPDARCGWKTVQLAKLWKGPSEHGLADAWYRLHFHLDAAPERPLAMYLVAFNRTGRLFVNGRVVRDLGAMQEPLPLNWNRSQYAVIPPAMLRAGDNEIEIQERAYGWDLGWLAPVRLGSEEELRPVWQRRVFWQNDLVRLLGACTGAIGVFMLGVWLGRRHDTMYFWFGCVSLLWTVFSLDYFALVPPSSPWLWERFIESAPVLRGVLMFMFVLRYCGMRRPVIETLSWLYFLIGAAAIFGEFMPTETIDLWYLVVLVASAYFFFLQTLVGLRRSLLEGLMLAIAGMVQMVLSGYDLWLYSANTWTDRVYLAHFSAPLYLFVVGTILIRRFTESLNAYEKLAGVLEQRVSAKAAELERNYEQLVEARRNEALALERTRIMSEMHDGIGSQLTMALSLVRRMDREADPAYNGEDGRVATVLRESIEDLQLIIDSLEPVENDLLTVLGTLRYRLQDRLGKGGIELQWNVVDLPPLPMLTPHSVLSILRIVQEAFANCLKHSGATRIAVTTGLKGEQGVDETAHIGIADNGHGFQPHRGVGRGMDNMRRRAAALGGRLLVTSHAGRTEVLLEFPTLRSAAA
ncbi:MAG: ATP-binding protein [Vitreoscilla sp.]